MLPELASAIPDAEHPSDHLPVKATFRLRTTMERIEGSARAWCSAVLEGVVDGIPLTREQLRLGFTLFDWNGDNTVDRRSFLAAINKIHPARQRSKHISLAQERGILMLQMEMSFRDFCDVYVAAASGTGDGTCPTVSNSPLQQAFEQLDADGDGCLSLAELQEALDVVGDLDGPGGNEEVPGSAALEALFAELDEDGSGRVSHLEFNRFVVEAFAEQHIHNVTE